jgi:FtsP/CotA-like multicopper oxidase with cupredoxin domain
MRHVAAMRRFVETVASRAISRGVTPARLGVSAFIGITTLIFMQSLGWGQNPPGPVALPSLSEVRGQHGAVDVTLRAVTAADGRDQYEYQGRTVPPVIRVAPGGRMNVTLINALSARSDETVSGSCWSMPPGPAKAIPCMQMTNLHFHGMQVSPNRPQDDVLTMMSHPGETLHYSVAVPAWEPPGLYWYHPHPHGESDKQMLDGMTGAIIVEGIDRIVPQVRGLRERVMVLRSRPFDDQRLPSGVVQTLQPLLNRGRQLEARGTPQAFAGVCKTQVAPAAYFTVNGVLDPAIDVAPGERQFWRIVNASGDSFADLQIDGATFEVVAMDGAPLAYRDPRHPTRVTDHVLLPPAGRLEAIVTGPRAGARATLRTRCVDTGPDGDSNPAMVLAEIVPGAHTTIRQPVARLQQEPAAFGMPQNLAQVEQSAPQATIIFTEDEAGFYINHHRFDPNDGPMFRVRVGSIAHWRVVNQTHEIHPFHIHQVHFLTYAVNGVPVQDPLWRDTMDVPPDGGTIDVILDARQPVVRGMAVFHCHMIRHEDKGMMAKVLFY